MQSTQEFCLLPPYRFVKYKSSDLMDTMSEPLKPRGLPITSEPIQQHLSHQPDKKQKHVPKDKKSRKISSSQKILTQSQSCNLSSLLNSSGSSSSLSTTSCNGESKRDTKGKNEDKGSNWELVASALKFIDDSNSSESNSDDEKTLESNHSCSIDVLDSLMLSTLKRLPESDITLETRINPRLSPLHLPFNPPMTWSKASSIFERWRLDSPIMNERSNELHNGLRRRRISDHNNSPPTLANRFKAPYSDEDDDDSDDDDNDSLEEDSFPPDPPSTSPPHSPLVRPPDCSTPALPGSLRTNSSNNIISSEPSDSTILSPFIETEDNSSSNIPVCWPNQLNSSKKYPDFPIKYNGMCNGNWGSLPPWLDAWVGDIESDLPPEERYHQPPKAVERDAAHRLAKRLYQLDRFKMIDVAKHLSKRNDFNQLVAEEYFTFFDFAGLTLVEALRLFLSRFVLLGDTQERERILLHFSHRYLHFYPMKYASEAACHTLVCAILLLNIDLHAHSLNNRPTSCEDFVRNLMSACIPCPVIPRAGEMGSTFYNNVFGLSSQDMSMTRVNGMATSCFNVNELKDIYEAVKSNPIYLVNDNGLAGMITIPKPIIPDLSQHILFGNVNPFLEVPSEKRVKEFMRGYLMRKLVMENHNKRAGLGKRSWKLFFVCLRDLVMYFYRDAESVPPLNRPQAITETFPKQTTTTTTTDQRNHSMETNGQEKQVNDVGEYSTVNNTTATTTTTSSSSSSPPQGNLYPVPPPPPEGTIRIEHSFAQRAMSYRKRPNVFHLRTKDGAEYLFHASDQKEMDLWIDSINFVAALLSAPPEMPARTRADGKLCRPFLPSSYTTNNIREQLEQHQLRILHLSKESCEHEKNPPPKCAKAKERNEYEEKVIYLREELLRYKTYARLLEGELTALQTVLLGHLNLLQQNQMAMSQMQAMNGVAAAAGGGAVNSNGGGLNALSSTVTMTPTTTPSLPSIPPSPSPHAPPSTLQLATSSVEELSSLVPVDANSSSSNNSNNLQINGKNDIETSSTSVALSSMVAPPPAPPQHNHRNNNNNGSNSNNNISVSASTIIRNGRIGGPPTVGLRRCSRTGIVKPMRTIQDNLALESSSAFGVHYNNHTLTSSSSSVVNGSIPVPPPGHTTLKQLNNQQTSYDASSNGASGGISSTTGNIYEIL